MQKRRCVVLQLTFIQSPGARHEAEIRRRGAIQAPFPGSYACTPVPEAPPQPHNAHGRIVKSTLTENHTNHSS